MDILVILLLILFNGLFSMAEFAIVSSRKSKLEHLATNGSQGSKAALILSQKPNMFLSSIQIGITLVTVLTGAIGEDRFSAQLSNVIRPIPVIGEYHATISFALIIAIITYLSIVIGELVPKKIALNDPEKVASFVAPFMLGFSRLTNPAIRLLSVSTEYLFKLLGQKTSPSVRITEDEVRVLVREGADMGVFSKTEKKLIERALMLDDLRVGLLMTPIHKVTTFFEMDFAKRSHALLKGYKHSRIILKGDEDDKIVGVINVNDLFENMPTDFSNMADWLKRLTYKPHLIPESMAAIKVLEIFRQSSIHIAFVLDEFGNILGILTLNDILEALVGEIKTQVPTSPDFVERQDGSLLVDGSTAFYDLKKRLDLKSLSKKQTTLYQTAAGFFIAQLDKIPQVGDHFEKYGYSFEVVDMDENRVDKILIKKINI